MPNTDTNTDTQIGGPETQRLLAAADALIECTSAGEKPDFTEIVAALEAAEPELRPHALDVQLLDLRQPIEGLVKPDPLKRPFTAWDAARVSARIRHEVDRIAVQAHLVDDVNRAASDLFAAEAALNDGREALEDAIRARDVDTITRLRTEVEIALPGGVDDARSELVRCHAVLAAVDAEAVPARRATADERALEASEVVARLQRDLDQAQAAKEVAGATASAWASIEERSAKTAAKRLAEADDQAVGAGRRAEERMHRAIGVKVWAEGEEQVDVPDSVPSLIRRSTLSGGADGSQTIRLAVAG